MMTRLSLLLCGLLLAGCATAPSTTTSPAPTEDAAQAATGTAQAASATSAAVETQPAQVAAAQRAARRAGGATDADDEASRTDLWVRVRRGFAMPELDTPLVRDREQWYATRPDYVARMTGR